MKTEQQAASPLHISLAPCAFLDGGTVLTKSGALFSVLKMSGVDAECKTPEQLAYVCQRFEGTLRGLGSEYRIYQYLMKRNSPELPVPDTQDRLAGARAAALADRSEELYSIEIFLVLLRVRPSLDQARASLFRQFSIKDSLVLRRAEVEREQKYLTDTTLSVQSQLDDLFQPVILDRVETLRFLRRLVNTTARNTDVYREPLSHHVDQQMCRAGVEFWPREMRQDANHVRFLSMHEMPELPPDRPAPNLLGDLLLIPANFIACFHWQRMENEDARRKIEAKQKHFDWGKTKVLSYIFTHERHSYAEAPRIDKSMVSITDEMDEAKKEMTGKGNHFGFLSFTLALWSEDEHVLSRAVAQASRVLSTHSGGLLEETYSMQNAFVSIVPGNYESMKRRLWATNVSFAEMSFLFAPATGQIRNEHLNSGPLIILETRTKTPYYANLHVEDVGHTLLLGATGSGKTYLTNALISAMQQYWPICSYIFDVMGKYRMLTKAYGGGYLDVGQKSEYRINPFALEPTPANKDFLFAFVRVLIERDGLLLTAEERKDLYRAIDDVYYLPNPKDRTLNVLRWSCGISYAKRLDEWVADGRLAEYFDNSEDTFSLNRFQTFDFGSMGKADALEPILFYILHRVNSVIHDPALKHVVKLCVLDEAWKFVKTPATRDYIHESLKTWRNWNGVMLLATQSGDDLKTSALLPTILEQCMTQIFLANPGMDRKLYQEQFGLNAVEADTIARLIPKREMLWSQSGGSKVLRLQTDPESHRVFAGLKD